MIRVFIPETKTKRNKTNVRGLWYSQDNKKVYYDYLSSQNYKDDNQAGLFNHIDNLKSFYNQECIFYSQENKGFIYYSKDRIEVLNNQKVYCKIGFYGLKDLIKKLLKEFNRVTIYQESQGIYKIEVYYND